MNVINLQYIHLLSHTKFVVIYLWIFFSEWIQCLSFPLFIVLSLSTFGHELYLNGPSAILFFFNIVHYSSKVKRTCLYYLHCFKVYRFNICWVIAEVHFEDMLLVCLKVLTCQEVFLFWSKVIEFPFFSSLSSDFPLHFVWLQNYRGYDFVYTFVLKMVDNIISNISFLSVLCIIIA